MSWMSDCLSVVPLKSDFIRPRSRVRPELGTFSLCFELYLDATVKHRNQYPSHTIHTIHMDIVLSWAVTKIINHV